VTQPVALLEDGLNGMTTLWVVHDRLPALVIWACRLMELIDRLAHAGDGGFEIGAA
jgi:hypothetical protein